MKAYLAKVIVVDHDEVGSAGVKSAIESARYANRCIIPKVASVEGVNIGEWSDEHPMNQINADWARYFDI